MTAPRETVALIGCFWCSWDRPDALRLGHSTLEGHQIIECIDDEACDARALTEARA